MKNFKITVNGTQYDVQVEELEGGAAVSAPVPAAKAAAPAAKPAAAPAPKGAAGGVKIESPMPGTIVSVNVTAGQAVKAGDILVVLEAMKMENEILAPQDGTVASVDVANGDSVNTGKLLVSLN